MVLSLFSTNTKYRCFLYLIFALFSVIVGLFLTFSLFLDISKLSLIPSFQDGVLTIFVPIRIYSNADTNRSQILKSNKGRAEIYQWAHILTGRIYIGSSYNLTLRLKDYYSKTYLEKNKSMHICNAIAHYGHSQFSLTIFEYINISNLSLEDARKLILEREQFYLNLLNPEFNILNTAGSSLGFNHSPVTLALMSKAKIGKNNRMYGKKVNRWGKR